MACRWFAGRPSCLRASAAFITCCSDILRVVSPASHASWRAPVRGLRYDRHKLGCMQALGATESLDEAAELLMKSKTNVRMVISKLEVDLGRHLDLPTIPGPAAAEEGKLLLVRLPKRSRSQLTTAGAALLMSSDVLWQRFLRPSSCGVAVHRSPAGLAVSSGQSNCAVPMLLWMCGEASWRCEASHQSA